MKNDNIKKKILKKFEKIDFQNVNSKWDILLYALCFNKEKNLKITSNEWNYLIFNSNLKHVLNDGYNAFMIILSKNQKDNLNFHEQTMNYLFKNSDLKQQNEIGMNAFMIALSRNARENLHFKEYQWDYLMKNSDLGQQNEDGCNALMLAIENYKKQELNFNTKQWDYLIKNSNLSQENKESGTVFLYGLTYNEKNEIHLSLEQKKQLWVALTEEQQQKQFQKVCTNFQNGLLKEKDILFMLYDLQFQPTKETIDWLEGYQYKIILKMLNNSRFFINLKEDLFEKNDIIKRVKI